MKESLSCSNFDKISFNNFPIIIKYFRENSYFNALKRDNLCKNKYLLSILSINFSKSSKFFCENILSGGVLIFLILLAFLIFKINLFDNFLV